MINQYALFNQPLHEINQSRALINTLNVHSYNTARKDKEFRKALQHSDILLPDGIGVVWALRLFNKLKLKKIAGEDLFHYEMHRVNQLGGKCFFLGSSNKTLQLIREKAATDYPRLQVYSYSPPFKTEFSAEESEAMVAAVNEVEPDVLFIGMTAPKQEKWAFKYFHQLNAGHICCIGAVFDFYAGTVKRAPHWMISVGMEWLYRLIAEPRRMWRRYLIGNTVFIAYVLMEKYIIRSRHPNTDAPIITQ